MNRLNWLFSLYSLDVLLLTIERFSFTTKILLQPYGFIRLHELLQGPVFLAISVLIPVFIIRELTKNFSSLKNKIQFYCLVVFITGAYIYGLGEGWHELASLTFNTHCDVDNIAGNLCGGLFINDYYTGNVLFYIGAIPMNLAVLFLDKLNPSKKWAKGDLTILFINAFLYSLTHFAYAAFDRVLIGIYSLLILVFISDLIFLFVRQKWREHPYIVYSAFAYTLATLAALFVRAL